jgi:hypothetical protein
LGFFLGKTRISNYIERIPTKTLVDALFDLSNVATATHENIQTVLSHLPDFLPGPDGQMVELAAKKKLQQAALDKYLSADELLQKVDAWIGGVLEQAAQEFRIQARRWVVFLSLIVTLALGVDSIELAQRFWADSGLVAAADLQAGIILQSSNEENAELADMSALLEQLDSMQVVQVGWWNNMPANANPMEWWVWKIVGLTITTLAVSQGSSFWYDILRQLKGEKNPSSSTTVPDDGIRKH